MLIYLPSTCRNDCFLQRALYTILILGVHIKLSDFFLSHTTIGSVQ